MPSDSAKNSGKGNGGYDGDYKAPEHSASTVRGSFMSDDKVGVQDGLSSRMDCDSEMLPHVKYNNMVDPISGNPRQVAEPYQDHSKTVTEKGHKMEIF